MAEDGIGFGGIVSHAQVESRVGVFLGSTCSGYGVKYVSDNRCFVVVFLTSVDNVGFRFVLGGLSFRGENPNSDLRWLYF